MLCEILTYMSNCQTVEEDQITTKNCKSEGLKFPCISRCIYEMLCESGLLCLENADGETKTKKKTLKNLTKHLFSSATHAAYFILRFMMIFLLFLHLQVSSSYQHACSARRWSCSYFPRTCTTTYTQPRRRLTRMGNMRRAMRRTAVTSHARASWRSKWAQHHRNRPILCRQSSVTWKIRFSCCEQFRRFSTWFRWRESASSCRDIWRHNFSCNRIRRRSSREHLAYWRWDLVFQSQELFLRNISWRRRSGRIGSSFLHHLRRSVCFCWWSLDVRWTIIKDSWLKRDRGEWN